MSNNHPEEKPENASKSPAQDWAERLELLRGLATVAQDTELAELELEQNGVRITLRGQSAIEAENASMLPAPFAAAPPVGVLPMPAMPAPSTPHGAASAAPAAKAVEENLATIVSPMVGMFYRAPSPSDPNFVEVGDKVEVGQTVALVEAMKVFNEITAEVAGTVAEIKANSGDLVETGQVLITIRQ